MSGGQKARVSLARCVYRKADVYLLDDPLSAVDVKVASNLMNMCFKEFLASSTVILIMNQLEHINLADKIYVMENGEVII